MTSCPSEATCSIYVDGELPAAEARPFEAHLVGCRSCRARVVALREESELIGEAMLDRPHRAFAARARAAPARGLALGFGPAVAAIALAAGVVSSLFEARPPSFVEWLNPLQLTGASEMVFDVFFALRDRVPGAFTFAVSVAALGSVAALLMFGLSLVLRRRRWPGGFAVVAAALLAAPPASEAHFGLHQHKDFRLPAGESHEGTLIVSGENVSIDGNVLGDLIVGADRVAVRGDVEGNVYAFARTLEIRGKVHGSVYGFDHVLLVSGEVGSDLYAFVEQLTIAPEARIARNASIIGEKSSVEGSVGRDLFLAGGWSEVRGSVERDLVPFHARVDLRETARVGRNVDGELKSEGDLAVAEGAVIGGEKRVRLAVEESKSSLARYREPGFYLFLGLGLVAALLVGLLAHAVLPGIFEERLETAGEFLGALGLGFLAFVAAPFALVLLAATLVGIPLAVIGLGVFATALYLSGIVVAALVGAALVRGETGGPRRFALVLLVGLLVVLTIAHLPFIAVPAHVVVILTGLGLLVRRARRWWALRTPPLHAPA